MIITKQMLQAVLPATEKNDTRYFLNGILVEPDGTCVTTNGHVLLRATQEYVGVQW